MGGVLLVPLKSRGSANFIIPPRLKVLQWSCHLFNWKNKKTKIIEKCIFIDEFQLNVHILKITRKLHGFNPRYNPKQKYRALFSSYILEIENYMEKRNLLVLDLSSESRLHDWEDVRHPTCLVIILKKKKPTW